MIRVACLILVLTTLSFAQSAPVPAVTGVGFGARNEIALNYTHVATDREDVKGLNGFTVSGSHGLIPWIAVTGEFGEYRGHGLSLQSFLGGPEVKLHISRFQPFVRMLFGISHESGTSFTFASGGGLDVYLKGHFAVRALQADYYRLGANGGSSSSSDYFRLGFGVVYEFGE